MAGFRCLTAPPRTFRRAPRGIPADAAAAACRTSAARVCPAVADPHRDPERFHLEKSEVA